MAREEKKYVNIKILYVFYSLCLIILVTFLFVSWQRTWAESESDITKELEVEGEISFNGGKTFQTYSRFHSIYEDEVGVCIFVGHFKSDVAAGDNIYMYIENMGVRAYLNDRIVYDCKEKDADPWGYFVSPGISTDDIIRIELTCVSKHVYNMTYAKVFDRLCYGSELGLLKYSMKICIAEIIISFIIATFGVCILIYRFNYRRIKEYNPEGLVSCGMMLIVGGATNFVNYTYCSLLFDNLEMLGRVDFLFQALLIIFLIGYIRRYLSTDHAVKRNIICVTIAMALLMLYMTVSIYYIEEIDRGTIETALIAFAAVLLFIEIGDLFKDKGNNIVSNIAFYSTVMLVICLLIEIGYLVITGIYLVKSLQLGLLLFAVLHYYLIIAVNAENYLEAERAKDLERELVQNKIKIMLSQIQPHFLYNALNTIRALCLKNPAEARNALDYFAKYLRANMDSLDVEGCIPFKKELEHVQSYLYIEKLRFGDLLNIEYDIGIEDFECPPLCIQTMVENAVKHGLLAKKEGGTLKISTRETENCIEIIISDDGVGFDMSKPNDMSRSHVGITNSRQRIMSICNGTLSVGSKLGVGTAITITLPKSADENL